MIFCDLVLPAAFQFQEIQEKSINNSMKHRSIKSRISLQLGNGTEDNRENMEFSISPSTNQSDVQENEDSDVSLLVSVLLLFFIFII
jgi:hypothetical protein